MKRVTGIGGIFFKAQDAKKLQAWYQKHLGLEMDGSGSSIFEWREREHEKVGSTTWAIFSQDTEYLDPGTASFMINYRVADLDKVLVELREEGVQVEDSIEEGEFGRFGWIIDPEGNKIELWEPPEGM